MAETGVLYAYGENNENRLGLGIIIFLINIKPQEEKLLPKIILNIFVEIVLQNDSILINILADDSWFAWPWTIYSSGDEEDVISVPTQIKSLKQRIGEYII